jgi:hypothetical protein
MLNPHTHAWSRGQRWLIVGASALAVALLTIGICVYERYYRGPGQEILYGTWEAPDFFSRGETEYFQFRADQTFSLGGIYHDEFSPYFGGRWYAGGPNIYIRFSADDIRAPQRVIVLHIIDIDAEEVHLRLTRDGQFYTFKRLALKSTSASNQSVELTATRRVFTLFVTTTSLLRAPLALGGGSSLLSR